MGPSKAASAGVELTTVRGDHLLADWLEALSLCLAGSEPGRLDDFRSFWADWSSGRIAGGKVTVVAWEGGPPPYGSYRPAAGVARLWESPHCGGKWFVEGLEVIASQRRRGVATSMLQLGIDRLREMQVVIPKAIRDAARLRPGARLDVSLEQGKIVLSPIDPLQTQDLYGRFGGSDLLGDLARDREAESRGEVVLERGNKQRNP
ncbi:MAG: GNAT family N-acetyltransferase [Bacillota bacterium]